MTDQLSFSPEGFAEMAYLASTGTPWHGLGDALEPGLSIEEWQKRARMAWKIRRSVVRFATQRPESPADANLLGLQELPASHVLFRSDTAAPLSIVSSKYQIVQPKEVLEFFRDLTESMGFVLETAGVLFGGRKFWALARITSDVAIRDLQDKVGGYLLLSTSCDGTMATEARFTSIRVVCHNTLSFARNSVAQFSLTHRSKWDPAEAKEELGLVSIQEQFESQIALFRNLAKVDLSPKETANLTAQLFTPKNIEDLVSEEIKEILETRAANKILHLAFGGQMGGDLSGTTGTAWGWLNAVTEYVDHDARSSSQDHRLNSAWFGQGDKMKKNALELVSVLG